MTADFSARFPGLALEEVDYMPSMTTYNGTGIRLFGRCGIPGEPEYYFSILCFSIFYAPIIPFRVYIVKRKFRLYTFAASVSLSEFRAHFPNGSRLIRSIFLSFRSLFVYSFLVLTPLVYLALHYRRAIDAFLIGQ